MSDRVFRLTTPHMTGTDVKLGQGDLRRKLDHWGVEDYPLVADGDYGVSTRAAYRTVCYGLGIEQDEMAAGVTPALRSKIRNSQLTAEERERYEDRAAWRDRLAKRFEAGGVAPPLAKILTHANGFAPGHDGADLICPRDAPGFAICRARVARVDAGGWWGLGAPRDPKVRSKGDGIVVLEALVTVGPIRKGMYIGYGHAEHARVRVGQIVSAGDWICRAGDANAPHFHFMVNGGGAKFRRDDGSPRGVGDRDPWPIVSYCIRNA